MAQARYADRTVAERLTLSRVGHVQQDAQPAARRTPVFKRSMTVETPRMATAYDSAREHIGPAFDSAKESGTHALQAALAAMIPVVAAAAPVVVAAKHKGADLLSSDAAHEARERAALMLAAAKGEAVARKRRRWPLVIAFFAVGAALGSVVTTWLQRWTDSTTTSYAEEGHVGPKLDLSHPLTEDEPQPVTVVTEVTADDDRVEDYSDPKATL
jgi:hypothetical protein